MNSYPLLKQVHLTCAFISIGGFLIRGLLMVRASPWFRKRSLRLMVDANDSLLLAAAVVMVVLSDQYPFVVPWVTAKVMGLLAYVGLGLVAFRFGPTLSIRLTAWGAALVVAGYIVSVAILKDPRGFLTGVIP
ncbi:SirB2 family protein [Denitratisoma oestradiolicum]|uniref:Regulator SirB n=1 Tax=Denitratisoma oestradiolicum TaxID=311182 RepID=A0A6S6XXQ6_9PROT|nr:SirB2 family protein [Denitratisoma oestradiolicum]TWO79897.1 hypothetical protein CBW56_12375 [Denitratisoma oestradiolicum]CAB1369649.1 Regulator SirB [Denitratisoma oestradiolicum]